MNLVVLMTSWAYGWECSSYYHLSHPDEDHSKRSWCNADICRHPPGDSAVYRFRSGDFSFAEQAALMEGDATWTAGPGLPLSDATFEFVAGPGLTSVRSFNDGTSSVSEEHSTWFADAGFDASTLAVSITTIKAWPGCGWRATDIVFNSVKPWSTSLPSDIPTDNGGHATAFSLGGVMSHELGHSFGLAHRDSPSRIHIMNAEYPRARSGPRRRRLSVLPNTPPRLVDR